MNSSPSIADEAIALLRALSGPHGIHASLSNTTNYRAIFTRDAVMAGVAGLLLEDEEITAGMVRTLAALRRLQGAEGQIASNYEEVSSAAAHVSFGTLAPRIDGATWYLIGIAAATRAGAIEAEEYRASVAQVVRLLDALEYNGRHLIYVPPGGNWADEYIYDGYILYDQVLRAWALRLLGETYTEPRWHDKSSRIARRIAESFWPAEARDRGHPIASFSPLGRRTTFDLAACSLLALSGLAPAMGGATLEWIATRFLDVGELPPAFHPVIEEDDPDWPALRRYHLHEFRNRPHEYHNGGIWPIWLGWLALALGANGRSHDVAKLATLVRDRVAALPAFEFQEYLHGVSGAPGGTPRMAYSATGLIFLEHAASPRLERLLTR